MNKQFFLNVLLLLFGFSALAVRPNVRRNNVKRAPVATHVKKETQPQAQIDDNTVDEQAETPTLDESWGKLVRLRWTSLSRHDAWNIGASIATCGIILCIYRNMPKNPMPDNTVHPTHDNDNHGPKIKVDPLEQKDCDICGETRNINEYTTMPCCEFSLCTVCLTAHLSTCLDKGSPEEVKCPSLGCPSKTIAQHTMKAITLNNNALYNRYMKIGLDAYFGQDEQIKHCPTPNCPYAFINDEDAQESFTCPQCRHTYCASCLKTHSTRMTCAQAEEDKKLTGNKTAAERADEQWKREHSKKCPQCRVDIEKSEGCNHMTCSRCKHEFCWSCGATYGASRCNYDYCATTNQAGLNPPQQQQNFQWNANNNQQNNQQPNGFNIFNNLFGDPAIQNAFNNLQNHLADMQNQHQPNGLNNQAQNINNQNIQNNGNANNRRRIQRNNRGR